MGKSPDRGKPFIPLTTVAGSIPREPPSYDSIQSRLGIVPSPTLPPITERVPQDVDPKAPFKSPRRVTYQSNDLCNLACEGCYIGQWLKPGGSVYEKNPRKQVPWAQFEGHMDALGPDLKEFFLLGAEPTMTPDASRRILQETQDRGLSIMAVTNGATRSDNFDRTFGELGPNGLHKLNISIDSMNPAIHDQMRGKQGALKATLHNLDRYVAMGYPVKAQMTVFPGNYGSIIDSVEKLYTEHGVRRFAFHCGSLEGIPDAADKGLEHVAPVAWRALMEKLYQFRQTHIGLGEGENIVEFNIPYIFFTRAEIAEHVIGDPKLAQTYFDHVDAVEAGSQAPLPFTACPKITVQDPYLFANDGPGGVGRLVSCQILTGGHEDMHYAQYDSTKKTFEVNTDPATSEIIFMQNSPHLCPAMDKATGGNTSDRIQTERGDMFHGCRYTSLDQMPYTPGAFSETDYQKYVTIYSKR